MTSPALKPQCPALAGWRAQVWALALFVALFKGLIPHAALAAALMQGAPALPWCAPGSAGAEAASNTSEEMGSTHACVCAAAGEATLLPGKLGPLPTARGQHEPLRALHTAALISPLRLPPARGPPAV